MNSFYLYNRETQAKHGYFGPLFLLVYNLCNNYSQKLSNTNI